jgi:hypothetical protein
MLEAGWDGSILDAEEAEGVFVSVTCNGRVVSCDQNFRMVSVAVLEQSAGNSVEHWGVSYSPPVVIARQWWVALPLIQYTPTSSVSFPLSR